MNRKQRRAARKQTPPGGRAGDPAAELFAEAVRNQQQNQLAEAARLYKHVLLLKPDHAVALNNLACVLQAQGRLHEASAEFARALLLVPQLLDQFGNVCATLVGVLPPLGEAMRRAAAAWPRRLPAQDLFDPAGIATVTADPLLRYVLQSISVRDFALELVLTALRASLLIEAGKTVDASVLDFICALAKQCFINEYVFATTPEEETRVARQTAAIEADDAITPSLLAAVAMYVPLHGLPGAQALLARQWPKPVDSLLTQQVREPAQEREMRASIPRLTAIEDAVSLRVQQQYEENPYPRWMHIPGQATRTPIDLYLREQFPTAAFTPLGKTDGLEILVAGCGTGRYPVLAAQRFEGAQILAVDLSVSSLCFAKRNTPLSLASQIEYAQGDILKLGSIGRSFDVVDAAGVLHHMADPLEAWRILLALVRPGGLMHLAFYSENGRADVVQGRALIAERGYGSTPAEIRHCRQELLETPLRSLTRFTDFFTTSECRDLLFHVQESRTTIPAIKQFIAERGLRFIGFEFEAPLLQNHRARFAQSGWSMSDLNRWHALETEYRDTFSGMYRFWVQKPVT